MLPASPSWQRVELGQQHGDCHAPCLFDGTRYCGQGRIAEVCPEDVVRTDDAHVFGHANAPCSEALEHPDGQQVVTQFVSLNQPNHLIDVPMVKTAIHAHAGSREAIRATIEKIQGKSAFQGTFNDNVFCGSFDTRL